MCGTEIRLMTTVVFHQLLIFFFVPVFIYHASQLYTSAFVALTRHHMNMFLAGLFNFVRVLGREIWVWVMSVLPEHLCTNSLSLIMSAHPILQVLDKEIRKARGGGHRKWREREGERGLKATSWVDVCQLTVNTLGSDYKTRANDSPMISLPNNVLHVSPSATFFPFSSIFIAPLLFPSSSSPQHFVTAVS